MITVTPQGNVYLCNVPLENDYNHQLTFANLTAQLTYFNSNVIKTFDNYTYIKKDSVIKIGVNIDEIMGCNYLFYRNNGFTNKYYFCFISNKEYINENCTALTIETDVFQTYQFDIEYKTCLVEREHVNSDIPGEHTIPEGLETGDYISTNLQPQGLGENDLFEYCYVVCASSLDNVFNGITYTYSNFKLPTGLYYIGLTDSLDIEKIIYAFDKAGQGDAVVSVFVSPKYFFSNWSEHPTIQITGESISLLGNMSTYVTSSMLFDYTISKPNYLGNNYIPKNQKLNSYPYSFLQVSNHSGQVLNYKWENFYINNNYIYQYGHVAYRFRVKGAMTPGGSLKAFPLNYNNIQNNNDDTIIIGKFPIGSYVNDMYTNWLTQSGVNVLGYTIPADKVIKARASEQIASNLLSLGEMAYSNPETTTQAISSGITNGFSIAFDAVQEIYKHKMVPDNVQGNINSGDVNFEYNLYGLEFKTMSIKNEFAEVIDNYFQMYGYKVNAVKTPNVTGRVYWNYVKTINCELGGNIPQEHLNILKNMFNKGVTFWHDSANMFNYSLTNSIVP